MSDPKCLKDEVHGSLWRCSGGLVLLREGCGFSMVSGFFLGFSMFRSTCRIV